MSATAPPAIAHLPQASLRPLHALLDETALIARCEGATPLAGTAHRVADAGAALVLAVSMAHDRYAETLARRCLIFVEAMHLGDGVFRPDDAAPGGEPGDAESSGWAIEGIGTATDAPWPDVRDRARRLFAAVTGTAADETRGRAHAVLGAVAAAAATDPVPGAAAMATRLCEGFDRPVAPDDPSWPWPESHLFPGSGVIAEARVAAAHAFRDDDLAGALEALRWFADVETAPGHLSPAAAHGGGHADPRPGFDQRPTAAAALAAAAGRALRITDDRTWERPVLLAAGWFAGSNDVGATMFDRDTGRAFDALRRDGADRCEGAEAAVAFATVLRELQRLRRVRPRPAPRDRTSGGTRYDHG